MDILTMFTMLVTTVTILEQYLIVFSKLYIRNASEIDVM